MDRGVIHKSLHGDRRRCALRPLAFYTNEKSRPDGRPSRNSFNLTVALAAQPPMRAVPERPSWRTQWTDEP
jgi:hypothetical protein